MPEFVRQLRHHLQAEWRLKLWLGALLTIACCAGYFIIQRLPLRTPATLTLTAIDRAIEFSPAWTWPYLSLNLLLPSAWLATTRMQLYRYAAGLTAIYIIAFTVFLIWPVAGPRPGDAAVFDSPAYQLLTHFDKPLNSFPSLHVALAVYSVCFAAHVATKRVRAIIPLLIAWAIVIAYSTLATKQHYFVDVPAGALLGWLGFAIAFHRRHVSLDRAPADVVAAAEGIAA